MFEEFFFENYSSWLTQLDLKMANLMAIFDDQPASLIHF